MPSREAGSPPGARRRVVPGEHGTPNQPRERTMTEPARGTAIGTNWAGNHTYRAAWLVRPRTLDELCEGVAGSTRVRAIGSRHSFSDLTDTSGTLVDLAGLPDGIRVDPDAAPVSVSGGVRYAELALALHEQGWALGAMASLPHISVAGAVASG